MADRRACGSACCSVAGCGGGDSTSREPAPPRGATGARPRQPAPAQSGDASTVELYFTSGEQFRKVERELPGEGFGGRARRRGARGRADESAQERLRVEAQTQIPRGRRGARRDRLERRHRHRRGLLGVPGRRAGETSRSASRAQQQALDARLGQVTYTLTQFARVEEAKVVSGGIGVEPALDREDYAKPSRRPDRGAGAARVAEHAGTRAVQRRLARAPLPPEDARWTASDGYRTQQAVIAFQSWEGLARDGIVGPITSAALAEARRPKPRGSGDARRIEVFREKGVALLVRNGRVKRAVHVSTGAPARPHAGRNVLGVPQGEDVLVGPVQPVAAVGVVLLPGDRVPRVPGACPPTRRRTAACGSRSPRRGSSTASPTWDEGRRLLTCLPPAWYEPPSRTVHLT